jgi:hypothetical protein
VTPSADDLSTVDTGDAVSVTREDKEASTSVVLASILVRLDLKGPFKRYILNFN